MESADNRSIDIFIPVLFQSDRYERCIESIQRHTPSLAYRIILVFSGELEHSNIPLYISAEKNIEKICCDDGGSIMAGINRGFKLSQNDVILCSPNVILTSRWAKKLSACVYMDDAIATATPLSNILFPELLGSRYSEISVTDSALDTCADEIERVSLRSYPRISAACSQCVYIRRRVIEEAGGFEEDAFCHVENAVRDLCLKASECGYHHVLCDDTYIYCGESDRMRDRQAEEGIMDDPETDILRERYPALGYENDLNGEPFQRIRMNCRLYRELNFQNGKKNILYFLLADFREGASNNVGGTQFHVRDLAYSLKDEYNIFVLARDQEYIRVTAYEGEKQLTFMFYIGPVPEYNIFHDRHQGDLYGNILKAFQIDLVHVQHTMWLSLDIYYQAHEMGIPIFLTIHDYYYICPTLKIMNQDRKVCVEGNTDNGCAACLKSEKNIYEGISYIDKWRVEHAKVLDLCEAVFFPSRSAADIFTQYYPKLKEKTRIIPHGIDVDYMGRPCEKTFNSLSGEKLKIAFVGGISEVKGGKLIYDLITKSSRSEYEWFIIGGIGYVDLYHLKQANLKKTGWYQRNELCGLLEENQIDIVCILSQIPETFCYTLSEAVHCRVPVIVTDIGALGERMREMNCGWLVPREISHVKLLNLLSHIKANPSEYEEKYERIKSLKVQTTAGMSLEYKENYEKLIFHSGQTYQFDADTILNGYLPGAFETRETVSGQNDGQASGQVSDRAASQSVSMENMQTLLAAQRELREIKDSLSFKLVSAMREVRFPMKQTLKRALMKMRKMK